MKWDTIAKCTISNHDSDRRRLASTDNEQYGPSDEVTDTRGHSGIGFLHRPH